jgi:DNA-binding MarR family transcriptional regulator
MAKQNDVDLQQQGDAIRRFNRFYTRAIGTLHAHLVGSVFTLAEARVIYEISRNERSTATQIAGNLNLDAGYLSRILAGFAKQRLIYARSLCERRQRILSLAYESRQGRVQLNR